MPVSTIAPPVQHQNTEGIVGMPHMFAAQAIEIELQDRLNVVGVVQLLGNAAGSGTDTIRVTDIGNIGFSLPMEALAGETDAVADAPIRLGYEEVVIGQFGLQQSTTYKSDLLTREGAITLDGLKAQVPNSWLRTFRDQTALTGSGITVAVGDAVSPLDVDDHLDLVAAYQETLGSRRPTAMIAPQQFTQLRDAYRSEPAFQQASADFSALQRLDSEGDGTVMQRFPDFAGLGIDMALTDSVVQSGGAYQGFAFPSGGIGWGVATVGQLRVNNPERAIFVDSFGLVIEELTDGSGQTTRRYRATAWKGFVLGSTRVHVLRRFISQI